MSALFSNSITWSSPPRIGLRVLKATSCFLHQDREGVVLEISDSQTTSPYQYPALHLGKGEYRFVGVVSILHTSTQCVL